MMFWAVIFTANVIAADKRVCYKDSKLEISYKSAECNDSKNGISQEKYLFEFTNKTSNAIEVSFERKAVYTSAEGREYSTKDTPTFKVALKANETVKGSCETKEKALFVFSKQLNLNASKLKSVEISNVNIK